MYVPAPRRETNGSSSASERVYVYDDFRRFDTLGEALAQPDNQSQSVSIGSTTRRNMQSGIFGRKFIDTNYSADYTAYTRSGEWIGATYSGSPKKYAGYRYRIAYDTGSWFGCFVWSDTTIVSPTATNANWRAVANRLAIANLVNKCQVECRIKAANQRIDLAETLSGLQQTAIMVATGTSQVVNAWKCARRGNWVGVFRHLGLEPRRLYGKTVSAKWLELQYGWLPLISDVYAGTQAIKEQLAPKDPVVQQFSVTDNGQTELIAPGATVSSVWESSTESSAGASVKVRMRLRVGDPFWAYMNSLNVLNPAYLVWVSLPFSFIIDWFLPVADMLQALTAPIGLQFTSGFVSTRSWCEVNVQVSARKDKTYVFQAGSAQASARAAYFRRSRLTAWPGVFLYYQFPFSSDKRLFSAVALLEQHRR